MLRRAPTSRHRTRRGGFGIAAVPLLVLAFASAFGREPLPLVEAAKRADHTALKALIDAGADVDAAEADGATALHWASYRDDLESADWLIRAGADVDAANDLGATPLWAASQNGSVPMVARLLEARAAPNAALLSGETPLMVAARSGSAEVVELLLAGGADLTARGARGQTALMWAVAQQHTDVVALLLERGADVDARSEVWGQVMGVLPHGQPENNRVIPHGGNTALMFAARVGELPAARLLLAAGADANDADAGGVSAMVVAAHSGYTDLVELLLEHGADANSAAAGFTALHAAVMRRDERMASALLKHGADPDVPVQAWTPTRRSSDDLHFPPALVGATPFWLAARFSNPALMRLLAAHGADPLYVHQPEYKNERSLEIVKESATALMAAVGMGAGRADAWVEPERAELEALTLEAVRLATELGVDINAVDVERRTALDGATALDYEAVIEYLVEHGAQPGAP